MVFAGSRIADWTEIDPAGSYSERGSLLHNKSSVFEARLGFERLVLTAEKNQIALVGCANTMIIGRVCEYRRYVAGIHHEPKSDFRRNANLQTAPSA